MSRTKARPKGAPGSPVLLALMLLSAVGVAALAAYIKLAPADRVPEGLRRPKVDVSQVPAMPSTPSASFLTPYFEQGELRFRSESRPVAAGEDPKVAVLNDYLRATGIVGEGVSVLSVSVVAGLATVSFGEGLPAGLSSQDEATLVNGIRAVLGQFPEVERVELMSNGSPVDTFGHFELTEPLEVIRPERWDHPTRPSEGPPPSPAG